MKLLRKVRRDALRFWNANTFVVGWTVSWRGCYISTLKYPTEYDYFFGDFIECQRKDFRRKLYHDYWQYKKWDYYRKYKKEQSK